MVTSGRLVNLTTLSITDSMEGTDLGMFQKDLELLKNRFKKNMEFQLNVTECSLLASGPKHVQIYLSYGRFSNKEERKVQSYLFIRVCNIKKKKKKDCDQKLIRSALRRLLYLLRPPWP